MKIAFIAHYYVPAPGGAERQLEIQAYQFAVNGCKVLILTRQKFDKTYPYKTHENLTVKNFNLNIPILGSVIFSIYCLIHLFRFRPNVLQPLLLMNTVTIAYFVSRLTKSKLIYKLAGAGFNGELCTALNDLGSRKRLNTVSRHFKVVAISKELEIDFKAQYPDADVLRIPNSVKVRDSITESKNKVILGVGRLDEGKNFSLLIESFYRSGLHKDGYTLEIYGKGPEEGKLVDLLKNYDLFNFASINEPVSNITEIMSKSAMLVICSKAEGMSNVMLEAMANGCPLITSRVSGVSDVLDDTRAYIMDSYDLQDYTDILKYVSENPQEAAQKAQKAYEFASKNLTPESVCSQYMQYFREK